MAMASTVLHFINVVSLFQAGDRLFALATAWFSILGALVFAAEMSGEGLMADIKRSVARGLGTNKLGFCLTVKSSMEASGIGFITAYAFTLARDLGGLKALSACMGVFLAAKDVGFAMHALHVGGCCKNAGQARLMAFRFLLPWKCTLGLRWCQIGMLVEFACFAVASRVLHPVITSALFVMPLVIGSSLTGVFQPHRLIEGYSVTLYGLDDVDGKEPNSSGPTLLCTLIRFGLLACLCTLTDLPRGLIDYGTLGRAMGSKVLQGEFIQPAFGLWHAVAEHDCSILGDSNFGHSMFMTTILGIVTLLSPLYIFGVAMHLLFNAHYSKGIVDQALEAEVARLAEEIEYYADGRDLAGAERPLLASG